MCSTNSFLDTMHRTLTRVGLALSSIASPAWATQADHGTLGVELGLWTLVPFVGLLLAIAILPLVAHHWWENDRNKALVAALFALPIGAYLVLAFGAAGVANLIEKGEEYVSFILLLASLFVITGGIHVRGSLSGTPLFNTILLGLGAVIANVIGTTGASVLLIRPLLRANERRARKTHIVIFFIFVVSNCGGLLTPLGDPPLFLGYLKGVPFGWTFELVPEWAIMNGGLLSIFHLWEQLAFRKEKRERPEELRVDPALHEPLRIEGARNFVFLLGVVVAIYGAGAGLLNAGDHWPFGIQEALMLALGVGAYLTTPAALRQANRFSFRPIIEVAVLFAGIFVTMAPALLVLNAWGQGQREVLGFTFGLSEPWHYFWATGALSGFLDNAPTYLTFTATASGMQGIPIDGRYLAELVQRGPEAEQLLAAISCGAVFMGANTYIGNGPNFMVKAIAEENHIPMPGFFGYMAYSGLILLPFFVLITYLMFL